MQDIWSRLDDYIYQSRWYLAAFLLGLTFLGAGAIAIMKPALFSWPDSSVLGETEIPSPPTVKSSGPTNLNLATQNELESLPGIGPVIAKRIVAYREAHGGFKTIEELMNVKGIGEKTFADLKGEITIHSP